MSECGKTADVIHPNSEIYTKALARSCSFSTSTHERGDETDMRDRTGRGTGRRNGKGNAESGNRDARQRHTSRRHEIDSVRTGRLVWLTTTPHMHLTHARRLDRTYHPRAGTPGPIEQRLRPLLHIQIHPCVEAGRTVVFGGTSSPHACSAGRSGAVSHARTRRRQTTRTSTSSRRTRPPSWGRRERRGWSDVVRVR